MRGIIERYFFPWSYIIPHKWTSYRNNDINETQGYKSPNSCYNRSYEKSSTYETKHRD
jgi:hypothetical protein